MNPPNDHYISTQTPTQDRKGEEYLRWSGGGGDSGGTQDAHREWRCEQSNAGTGAWEEDSLALCFVDC